MAHETDKTPLAEILDRFQPDRASLIPLLQEVQAEYGYIPPDAIEPVANRAGVFPSEVTGVISFYAQFYTSPRGRNVIKVCRGTACHVRGGRTVLQTVMKCTGIKDGETSQDMRFSLETVACLGACALSPVMVANRTYYGMLNPGRIEAILRDLL